MSKSRRGYSKILTAVLLFVLACRASFAQEPSTDWTRVQILPIETAVSIKTKSGMKYHGELADATADELAIDSDEPAFPGRAIRRRQFKREDVREVRLVAPRTSVLAGTGIGGAVGAGVGVGLDATAKSHEYRGLMALLMGALGAGIGAAVALHHPFVKGKKIYAAP
jgi:hypothetical protein